MRGAAAVLAAAAVTVGLAACSKEGRHPRLDAYCAKARSVETAGDALEDVDITDTAAVRQTMLQVQADAHAAVKVAPDAVHDDAREVSRDIDDLVKVLSDAGFDVTRVDASRVDRVTGHSQQAQERVRAFNERACRISPTTQPSPGGQQTVTSTGPTTVPSTGIGPG